MIAIFTALAFDPVVERLSGGEVNWTALEVTGAAEGAVGSGPDVSTVEGEARRRLGPLMLDLAREVRFSSTRSTGDVMDAEDATADKVNANLSQWEVYESRYFASGRVELDASIGLQSLLRPAMVAAARGKELEGPPVGATSGLVLDARGLELKPALAPRLRAVDGRSLYGIETMTGHAASLRTPVVYVTDPADPVAVRRAGEQPLFVRVLAVADGSDLVVDVTVAESILAAAADAPFLRHGQVVVVVGP